jgi:hypothetical protein
MEKLLGLLKGLSHEILYILNTPFHNETGAIPSHYYHEKIDTNDLRINGLDLLGCKICEDVRYAFAMPLLILCWRIFKMSHKGLFS